MRHGSCLREHVHANAAPVFPDDATVRMRPGVGSLPSTVHASSSLKVAVSSAAPRSGQNPLKAIQRFGKRSMPASPLL